MVEALAVRLGVSDASRFGFSNIIVESDNAGLISRLKAKAFSAWDFASIEDDTVVMTACFSSVSFSYINRSCNCVTDWVAKSTRAGICPVDWVPTVPNDLFALL
ncbi:hypothetical protein GQ457_10G021830 [Hibiscus cannabinus]